MFRTYLSDEDTKIGEFCILGGGEEGFSDKMFTWVSGATY